jgi:hypothetical protein
MLAFNITAKSLAGAADVSVSNTDARSSSGPDDVALMQMHTSKQI